MPHDALALYRMMAEQELPFDMRSRLRSFFLSNRFLMQHLSLGLSRSNRPYHGMPARRSRIQRLSQPQGPGINSCRLRLCFVASRHQQELLGQLSPQLQSEASLVRFDLHSDAVWQPRSLRFSCCRQVCTELHLTWIAKVHFFAQFMRLVDALDTRRGI